MRTCSCSFISLLALALAGCGNAPIDVSAPRDSGTAIDCGQSLFPTQIALGPGVTLPGNLEDLELTLTGRNTPIVALNLKIYYSLDNGPWRLYAQTGDINYRRTDQAQVEYLRCATTIRAQMGPIIPFRVRFRVPFSGGYRFVVVGTGQSLDKDGLQIGARGQTGRDLSCSTSITMQCNGRPCPNQPITFEPQDEPTGTLLCGWEVRR